MARLRAQDVEHLADHDVATGVRVLTRELHRGDVRITQLRADLEQHRRRVHLARDCTLAEGLALGKREEAGGRLVTETTRAEVDTGPDVTLLVLHQVDVVVARADGSELRLRKLRKLALRLEICG